MGRGRSVGFLTALVGAGVVGGLMKFNMLTGFGDRYFMVNLIGLFWVPMMFIFLIARDEPARFGFTLGDSRRAWWIVLVLLAGVVALEIPASRMQRFQDYYPILKEAVLSPWSFVLVAAMWGLYFFCWEYFFRGFLLFGLNRYIGWWAVLVQAIPFGLMHHSKPPLEFAVSFPAGIILGMLALRAKSFFPCFLLHWSAAIAMDLLVLWSRRG